MASKLLSVLVAEDTIFNVAANGEEKKYLDKYQQMVKKRCEYLLKQSADILSVKL